MAGRASMNHIYRSVWNKALGAMVAVAEIQPVSAPGSARSSRRSRAVLALRAGPGATGAPGALALLAASMALGPNVQAQTLPQGGVAIHGSANLNYSQVNKLTVTTANGAGTGHSALNWNSFNIGAGSTTQFVQPSAASLSINRVVTNTPSQLFGTLSSNGRIVLVNQAGIAVGAGALVDTAGFTASAVGMKEADAISGRLRFGGSELGSHSGALTVEGNIIARGGDVVLIAPSIDLAKTAVVESQGGGVSLAAGQSVEITGRGLEGISLQVRAPADQAINLGTLKGDAVGIFAGTLRHSGLIQAVTADFVGGKVVLRALGDAVVEGSGRVLATSDAAGAKGGSVDVLGQRVAIADQVLIDVSGRAGGGHIRIGGDFQGKNAEVPNAQVTYLGPDATLKADALDRGIGGRVIVWADDTTRAYGNISVRGGASGGDGGFVETSGKRYLSATRAPDIAAPLGKGGLWLLDPNDIDIIHATGPADVSIQFGGINPVNMSPSQANNSASTLTDFTINSALASGDVWVLTASGNGGTGDINFDPSVGGAVVVSNPSTLARGLILTADGGVRFKAGTTTFQSPGSTSALNVQLNGNFGATSDAGAVVTLNGAGASGLALATLDTTRTWTNNGTLNITGNAAVHLNESLGASTFTNAAGGVVNVAGTTGFAFYSGPANSSVIDNQSLINVTQVTAFEARYSQSASGTLNIKDTNLNLQDVLSVSGTVDLKPAGAVVPGSLNLTEHHASPGTFSNTSFPSPGFLNVDGSVGGTPVATFNSVSAGQTQLSVGAGQLGSIAVGPGNTTFAGINIGPGGAFSSINSANLGIKGGNFSIPLIGSYNGSVGLYATGNVTLPVSTPISSTGDLTIMASWDGVSTMGPGALQQPTGTGTVSLQSGVGVAGTLTLQARGDITQTSSAINASNLIASTDGNIVLNLGNSITASVDLLSASGGINFNNAISSFNLTSAIADQSIDITTTGSLTTVGPVQSSTGDVTITAPGGMSLGGNVVAAVNMTLDSSAGNGFINQTAGFMNAPGATTVNAGTGDVALFSAGNNFNTISLTGGHISVVDANALNVASLSFGASKNLYLQAGGALALPVGPLNTTAQLSLISGGALTTPGDVSGSDVILAGNGGLTINNNVNATSSLNLTGGSITQNPGTAISAPGVLTTITAIGQTVTLAQPGNDFGTVAATAGSLTVHDGNSISLGNVNAGSLNVRTNSTISQSAGTALSISSGGATFDSGGGNMLLTNAGNSLTSVAVANGGNVSITDSGASTALGSINAGSITFLAASGNIVYGQDITATSGVIDIKGFGAVSATAPVNISSTSQILLKATGNLNLAGTAFHSAGGGDVILASGGQFLASGATTNFTSGGRWLTYLTNPSPTAGHVYGTTFNPITGADFRQVGIAFQTAPVAAGNGSLWSDSGSVSSTLTGTVAKTYDTTTAVNLGPAFGGTLFASAPGFLFSGETGGNLTTAVGALASPNVGTGIVVTMAPLALTGVVDGGGKPTYGYVLSASGNVGTVNPAAVGTTVGLNGLREYDGTSIVSAGIFTLSGLVGSQTLTLSGAGTITDKNVGLNKPVTLGSLLLGNGTNGGLASNYTFSGGTHVATITPRTTSTWSGGTGNWSDATKWDAGTARPDGNNVLKVIIPSGSVVTFDSSVGNTAVQNIQSDGRVVLSSGQLSVSDSFKTFQYGQLGGLVGGAGNLVVDNSFSKSGGVIAMGGLVDITQANGTLNVGGISGANILLAAPNGSIVQSSPVAASGVLAAHAGNGITLNASNNSLNAFLALADNGNVQLTNVGAINIMGVGAQNGDIKIANTGAIAVTGRVVAPQGKVQMMANSPLLVAQDGSITSSGDIDLLATNQTSAGNMFINGNLVSINGAITLAAAGDLTQNGWLFAGGAINATAGGGITFGPLALSSGSPVRYLANGARVPNPPSSLAELLARNNGTGAFINEFLDKFEDALEARPDKDQDPRHRKNTAELVVEGETCRP